MRWRKNQSTPFKHFHPFCYLAFDIGRSAGYKELLRAHGAAEADIRAKLLIQLWKSHPSCIDLDDIEDVDAQLDEYRYHLDDAPAGMKHHPRMMRMDHVNEALIDAAEKPHEFFRAEQKPLLRRHVLPDMNDVNTALSRLQ